MCYEVDNAIDVPSRNENAPKVDEAATETGRAD